MARPRSSLLGIALFASLSVVAGCAGGAPAAAGPPGVALLARLAGLWTGPATMTLLGDFPLMNVDFRPATEGMLFGRVDLDVENSLRMAFDVETMQGGDVVVFRNGGLFTGLSRDTRTVLVDADDAAGVYHFCATEAQGGCGYTDAVWTFDDPTHVVLEVHVRGAPHLTWDARRAEERDVPAPFPAPSARGTPDAPFPPMPSLGVSVRWTTPLAAACDVWLVLATEPCLDGTCVPSRWLRIPAAAGATSAAATIDQIHAGAYLATAIVDRDGTTTTSLAPGPTSGVTFPDANVTVAASGSSTATLTVVLRP